MAQLGELIRNSRTNRGLTQEQAVQLLPYELRTLQAYECDERKETPWQAVEVIAKAYNDKALLFLALQQNEVWQACLPSVRQRSLSEAGCAMLDDLWELDKHRQSIMHIIRDGCVSENEKKTWSDAKVRMYLLLASLIELLIADGQLDTEILQSIWGQR